MRDAYGMIGIFQHDDIGSLFQGGDMIAQVWQIDPIPDRCCKLYQLCL